MLIWEANMHGSHSKELAASSTEAVAKSRKVRGVHVRGYGVHVRFIVIDHFLAST